MTGTKPTRPAKSQGVYDRLGVSSAHGHAYRPEIDGLRAVAVLVVVLFHADVAVFGGGFVGVDVFFVISGFLITAIIEKDVAAGRFSFARFYERRVRRILPALVAVSFFCILVGAFVYIPTDFDQLGQGLIGMALFTSNLFFREDLGVQGYFQSGASLPILTHTWSLAVEEQFYLVLPPVLLVAHRYTPTSVKLGIVVLTIASFVGSEFLVRTNPSDAFYLLTSRAWELLIGSLLAVHRFPTLQSRWSRELAMGLGAASIVGAAVGYTKATPFPGVSATLPCLGGWLILYAGNQGSSVVGTILSLKPTVYVGRISYSLYLWHLPILVVTKYVTGGRFTLIALCLSFIAAGLSYRFVETPFRFGRPALPRQYVFATTGGTILALIAAGWIIVANKGFPGRFDTRSQTLIAQNLDREKDFTGDPTCDNFRREISSARDVLSCPIGPPDAKKILIWGDSHAGEMRPVIEGLFREGALRGHGVTFAIAPACVPSVRMERLGDRLHCSQLARYALDRALAPDVDTVLIFASGYRLAHDDQLCRVEANSCVALTKEQALDLLASDYIDDVRLLESKGKRVIIGLPDPSYNRHVPRYEILKATVPALTSLRPLKRDDFAAMRARLLAVAHETGASVFDPRAILCDGDRCRYEDDGVSLYFDNDHIARTMMGVFHDGLRDALKVEVRKP